MAQPRSPVCLLFLEQKNGLASAIEIERKVIHAGRAFSEGGNPVKSRHWIPGQARNDEFIEVPLMQGHPRASEELAAAIAQVAKV
ncbi:MAG: hypothetical protein CVU16_06020 [Betaproteobacteria bacterium HGW-Betaproteobacteria-10]|nr:MAG: hypothetical protein CVU16_06020 [Betaproteobacteria bacterium HGW-Betaproteobacteria-10]